MAINGKPCLLFNELGQFLEWAHHEVGDLSATATLDVMMVHAPIRYFIAHLAFVKLYGIDQAQLLEHRKIAVHCDEIGCLMPFDQTRMHVGRCNRQGTPFKNGENRFPCPCQLFAASFEAVED